MTSTVIRNKQNKVNNVMHNEVIMMTSGRVI